MWELHRNGYFPAVIARHLSDRYAHLNGGYRSTETVKDTIKMLEKREEVMGSAFPEELPDLRDTSSEDTKLPDMRKNNGKKVVKIPGPYAPKPPKPRK
jgi:hypothetical protein